MISADTSTWVAYFQGGDAEDTRVLDQALRDRQVLMVPVVLTELLSDAAIARNLAKTLCEIPRIEVDSGFWERAGILRAKVLAKGLRARLGDALIAQCCIDHGVRLLTRDRDFRAFAESGGLDVLLA
jgi:predicted nucleic acid-binding protein